MYIVTTFYKFTNIEGYELQKALKVICPDLEISGPVRLQRALKTFCLEQGIRGTIIIATEGINSTIVGSRNAINEFYRFFKSFEAFADVFFQESECEFMPFQKMKVRVKPEIVTFKVPDLDLSKKGEYVSPEKWDNLISDPKVMVIDTRNYYEIAQGSFKNAINPNTNKFTELVEWVQHESRLKDRNTPIAMFCTGGVRCEKSTAYLKMLGYKEVYHLKGGIINYLKAKRNKESAWEGNCFIFDDRVNVNQDLSPDCL